LTTGPDEKRARFIRDDEFVHSESANPMNPQASGPRVFVGESRLMRELLFLVEGDKKAVVYFTQSAGELDIGERRELPPSMTAKALREYLGRNYLEVRPLKFDEEKPQVPDDASVVIVAEPREQLADAHVAALRKYMTEPHAGKKGKLIVVSGPQFAPPPGSEVKRTGLEGLLAEFGVRFEPRLLVHWGSNEIPDPFVFLAGFSLASTRPPARNPVALAMGEKTVFQSRLWREVGVLQVAPPLQAVPLLLTMNPGSDFSWLEDRRPTSSEFGQIVIQLRKDPEARKKKQPTDDPRSVAVAVSEGDTGRVMALGTGWLVSDEYAQRVRRAGGDQPESFDFMSGTVDWLRDRPPLTIQIQEKKYQTFKFPAKTDRFRGLWLPLLLSMILVTGVGASMWVIRRRV
jgi:hypothetical protein